MAVQEDPTDEQVGQHQSYDGKDEADLSPFGAPCNPWQLPEPSNAVLEQCCHAACDHADACCHQDDHIPWPQPFVPLILYPGPARQCPQFGCPFPLQDCLDS